MDQSFVSVDLISTDMFLPSRVSVAILAKCNAGPGSRTAYVCMGQRFVGGESSKRSADSFLSNYPILSNTTLF